MEWVLEQAYLYQKVQILITLSLDLSCLIIYYIIYVFCIRASVFRKEFFVKNGMCRAENNISLYIVYKAIAIILIPNEYHQFRTWHKFINVKFVREKHILYN